MKVEGEIFSNGKLLGQAVAEISTPPTTLEKMDVKHMLSILSDSTKRFLQASVFEPDREHVQELLKKAVSEYLDEIAKRHGILPEHSCEAWIVKAFELQQGRSVKLVLIDTKGDRHRLKRRYQSRRRARVLGKQHVRSDHKVWISFAMPKFHNLQIRGKYAEIG